MSTFTIFFCGTSSNQRDYNKKHIFHQGELVSTLAKHASGIEYQDYLIVDGVGSGYIIMKILKNDDDIGNRAMYSIEGSPASNYQAVTGSGIFKLTTSDNVRVTIYSDSDTSVSLTSDSIFSGHLIG